MRWWGVNLKFYRFAVLLFLWAGSVSVQGQSQSEMNQEAAASAAKADKELNNVYKKLVATLDDEGKALLKTSQIAWLAYRDAEAKFGADEMRGGSAAPLLYHGTMATVNKARIAVLRAHLGEETAENDDPAAAPAAPQKVIYQKCISYAGSSELHFKDADGADVVVSVMNKLQRTGMTPDEPYIKYPEKMIGPPAEGGAEANPAMVGKAFLLVTGKDGEIAVIKVAP